MVGIGMNSWGDVEGFLVSIYGADAPLVWTTGFRDIEAGPSWHGSQGLGRLRAGFPGVDEGDFYFCIGTMQSGADRRSNGNVFSQPLLIVDDIGDGGPGAGSKVPRARWDAMFALGCPRPTFRIETSPGNETWGWVLAGGEAAARDPVRFADMALLRAHLLERGLTDNVMDEARYIRLPVGWNSKGKYRAEGVGVEQSPRVRLVEWEPSRVVDVDALGVALSGVSGGPGADWRSAPLCMGPGAVMLTSQQIGQMGMGALRRCADMTDPEGLIVLAEEIGMQPRQVAPGAVEALCPNIAQHTSRPETGFAFLGNGLMHCHHASCQGLRSPDFRSMMETAYETQTAAARILGTLAPGTPLTAGAFIARAEGRRPGAGSVSAVEAEGQALAGRMAVAQIMAEEDLADALDALALRFVWVRVPSVWFDTRSRKSYTREAFDCLKEVTAVIPVGETGKKRASNVLLNKPGRQEVEDFMVIPGDARPLVVKPGQDGVTRAYANKWVPGSDVKRVAGTPDFWLELLEHVIPDRDYREWLICWFALLVQRRGTRLMTMPVIQGGQGIGKDWLLRPILAIMGTPTNAREVTHTQVTSPFNGWQSVELAVLTELKLDGAGEMYNRIKDWLGDGAVQWLTINEKFKAPIYTPAAFSLIATTNHEHALQGMEADDRRIAPYFSPAGKKDAAWYARVVGALQTDDEKGRVLDYLMRVDLVAAGFTPHTPAPDTSGSKVAALRRSLTGLAEWVADQFEAGGKLYGRKLVTSREVGEMAVAARAAPVSGSNGAAIRRGLLAVGAIHVQPTLRARLDDGPKARFWAAPEGRNRVAAYNFLTTDELKAEWERDKAAAILGGSGAA